MSPTESRTGMRSELTGLALLAVALAFNAIFLAPELRIGGLAWNDTTFHIAASERLMQSLARGEPFLDPWVSEWSLGYPVWRSYQPLPHLVAGAVFWLTGRFADHATAFAALQYVLLVLLPLSTYVGARLLRLGSVGAGLAALLIFTPAGAGDLSRYGIGYGAFVWRGSGLYTQLFALHLLVLSLGVVSRALDGGRRRALAAVLLAATTLSHVIFGYVAFVSAVLCAIVGPSRKGARRLVRLATIVLPALLLLAWFAVPLWLTAAEVNHSRFEPAYKWDSFGAGFVLSNLCSGALLDGGRLPVLSLLVAVGVLAAGLSWRDIVARRLAALGFTWLVLFFGRATWGRLLVLAAVPGDFHLHRLQAAFELAAVLLAAWGFDRVLRAAAVRGRPLAACATAGLLGALVLLGIDRAEYLRENTRLGEASVAAYQGERTHVQQALAAAGAILVERPGRVSAGKRATWGDSFKIGDLPMYVFVTQAHLDAVSFLYHSMSLTSDVMALRNEDDAAHDAAFGVRVLIAPVDRPVPPHLRLRGRYGRFAVYEDSAEGYFGLVDVGARYTGALSTMYEPSATWMESAWSRQGLVVALGGNVPNVPALARWEPFPAPPPALLTTRGQVTEESKDGETYRARIHAERACYALVKITWYPDLVATVDGQRTPLLRVTPGFAAVPVAAGDHAVEVRYAPGPLKPALFVAGILLFAIVTAALRSSAAATAEHAAAAHLARAGHRFDTPNSPLKKPKEPFDKLRVSGKGPMKSGWGSAHAEPVEAVGGVLQSTANTTTAAALLVLIVLALHPLFRGQLINGHDATAYPPRVVEFSRALRDGQIPPVWAPDLGAGYGQPLFQFAPPLLYLAAAPFHAAGCGLTDALQFGLACLCAAGAIAVFLLGRRTGASHAAALGGAAAWLFAPYLALDLYVRAAFAEAAAMAIAPVALLGLVAALDRPSAWRVARGSALVALIPLAHNAVALLMLPAFALVILARRSWRAYATGAAVLIAGLGLSAFFWLPALVEQSFVKTDLLREGFLHWSVHAISPMQLIWSAWGYGHSVPGPDDGMSFAIGPVHLALAALGLGVAWRARDRTRAGEAVASEAVAFAAAATAGAWLATSWSAPVWSHVETLRYLTHPWRTLLLPATFLPLLAVPAFDWLRPRTRMWAIVLLVGANLAHAVPKGFLTFDEEYYTPESIAQKGLNTTTYEEYEPRWVGTRPPYANQRLTGQPPLAQVVPISLRSAHQEFRAIAETSTVAEAATFYYPGWKVFVDGQETTVAPVPGHGTMSFHLPPGTHHVSLDLQPTALRHVAILLTVMIATALACAVVVACLVNLARSAR